MVHLPSSTISPKTIFLMLPMNTKDTVIEDNLKLSDGTFKDLPKPLILLFLNLFSKLICPKTLINSTNKNIISLCMRNLDYNILKNIKQSLTNCSKPWTSVRVILLMSSEYFKSISQFNIPKPQGIKCWNNFLRNLAPQNSIWKT